jgi:thiol:disulfide interchange protein DsbD
MAGSDLLSKGYFFAFLTVFVGGVLTSLTPCVYPLISITVSLFGAREGGISRLRASMLGAAYVAGICVMYTSLGVFSALGGRAFGTFMADAKVIVPVAIVLLVMAASMFGAFELNLPSGLATRLSSVGGKGPVGAFLMGLVGGIIAAPCTGPVLASILAYVAKERSVALGGSLLFTYALGMGTLFFVVATFASALPRSGPWMETVKSVFGVAMVLAALYFLRNVWPSLSTFGWHTPGFLGACLLLAAVGIAVGGLTLSFHGTRREQARKAAGVLALVVGGFGGIGWTLAAPTPTATAPLVWTEGEAAGVAAAHAAHKPALLDFYATWCLPCKELELKTFHDPEVATALGRFQLIKVDCSSDEDPKVVEVQKRYQADTLPTVVLLDSDGKVAHKIDRVVEPRELLSQLAAVH